MFSKADDYSEYVLCGNYYKIIETSNRDNGNFVILKKRHFGFLYLTLRIYKTHDDAIVAIFKDCKISVCPQCFEPLIQDQFGLFCPNEECGCMGSERFDFGKTRRYWTGRDLNDSKKA